MALSTPPPLTRGAYQTRPTPPPALTPTPSQTTTNSEPFLSCSRVKDSTSATHRGVGVRRYNCRVAQFGVKVGSRTTTNSNLVVLSKHWVAFTLSWHVLLFHILMFLLDERSKHYQTKGGFLSRGWPLLWPVGQPQNFFSPIFCFCSVGKHCPFLEK